MGFFDRVLRLFRKEDKDNGREFKSLLREEVHPATPGEPAAEEKWVTLQEMTDSMPEEVREIMLARAAQIYADEPTRQHHYWFAHNMMHVVARNDPMTTLVILNEPEMAASVLKTQWDHFGEAFPEEDRLPADGLEVVLYKRHRDYAVGIIALPPPERGRECYYVALAYGPFNRNPGRETEESIATMPMRYFTLERTYQEPGEPLATYIGEWESEDSRRNHGDGPAPDDPLDFFNRVCILLD